MHPLPAAESTLADAPDHAKPYDFVSVRGFQPHQNMFGMKDDGEPVDAMAAAATRLSQSTRCR